MPEFFMPQLLIKELWIRYRDDEEQGFPLLKFLHCRPMLAIVYKAMSEW